MARSSLGMAGPAALAAVVATAATAPYASAGFDATARAALSRLPKDTAVVATIDVAALRKTSLFGQTLRALRRDREISAALDSLRAEVGFDPRRHLHRIWFALPGGRGASATADHATILIRLKIDQDRFLAWLKTSHAASARRTAGGTPYHVSGQTAFAFLGDGWLLLSEADLAARWIESYERTGGRTMHHAQLRAAIRRAAKPGAHAWIAARVPHAVKKELRAAPLHRGLADLEWSAAHLTFGAKAQFRGHLQTSSSKAAEATAMVLRQLVELAAGSRRAVDTGLAEALRATAIRAEGAAVHIHGQIAGARLSAALEALLLP